MKRIYLEITNSCNLNCSFCSYEKGHSFLSIEEIYDYLNQIKPICNYIYLHILGEPLLHPDFNRILDYLDQLEMNLQLVTNGTLLNKYPDILNHKCLRKLSISIHSINYLDINSNYFNTINNMIENNNNKTIELRFYDKNNLDDNLKKYLKHLENTCSFIVTSKDNSYKLKNNVYVYFEELFKWPDINDEIIGFNGYCHGGIDMLAINHNSDVCICCLDPKAFNKIGNLKDNSLKEIIESDGYKDIVDKFKQRKIICDLCSRCSYRLRFK